MKKLFLHLFVWFIATVFLTFFIHNEEIWFPYRAIFNMYWLYGNLYLHTILLVPVLEKGMLKWQNKDGILDPYIRRLKWMLNGG